MPDGQTWWIMLQAGDFIRGSDGSPWRVERLTASGPDKTFRGGSEEVMCLVTLRNKDGQWVQVTRPARGPVVNIYNPDGPVIELVQRELGGEVIYVGERRR